MTNRDAPAAARQSQPPFLARMGYRGYEPGRSFAIRTAWYLVQAIVFSNPVVTSFRLKRALLRAFGAKVGSGVLIKPRVQVKYPWHLTIGDDAWIGEGAWIDNFVSVTIGSNACISQGAYLCTGNHDWSSDCMDMLLKPISVGDGAWVGAFARIAPGVSVGDRSIVTLGSVLFGDSEPEMIYSGNPAVAGKRRVFREQPGS